MSEKSDARPVSECIKEIQAYDYREATPERLEDLEILRYELGDDYDLKIWFWGQKIRVAVIKEGYRV